MVHQAVDATVPPLAIDCMAANWRPGREYKAQRTSHKARMLGGLMGDGGTCPLYDPLYLNRSCEFPSCA